MNAAGVLRTQRATTKITRHTKRISKYSSNTNDIKRK